MSRTNPDIILAVNAGSSSLKVTAFGADGELRRYAAAAVERIGITGSRLSLSSEDRRTVESLEVADFPSALRLALAALGKSLAFAIAPRAIGHRIVHGGADHRLPMPITPALLADLGRLSSVDPTHTPQALALIDALTQSHPDVAQFACFDTGFHRTMPRVAQLYPLPRTTWTAGIRRYGFHGLSCEYVLTALREADPNAADSRLLIAHLGNGASITAVHHGISVDTTMGFSPTGGLMMGTRSGDLDPGVVTYLARTGYTADALQDLVTEHAGLLGVSGVSSDMEELLNRTDSPEAREAIALYCYVARKHVGSLAAALQGLDTLVFTGGIGEHAPAIRAGICGGLEFLGMQIDPGRNATNGPIISSRDSRVTVRVMQTDEDLVIASHVRRLIE